MKLFRLEIISTITYIFVAEGAQTTDERQRAHWISRPPESPLLHLDAPDFFFFLFS